MWLSRIVTVMSSWLNVSKRNRDGSNEGVFQGIKCKAFSAVPRKEFFAV